MALVVLVPALLAFVFGFFAFRSRIKGVYFSIITQALTFAAMLLFFRNETGFGGNNGFTDFKRILGVPIATPGMRMLLFVITGAALIGFFLMARAIVNSKYGRVLQAIRDAESRVMFTGYNPVAYKLSIWTLSAAMCGVAGALYVPQVGIINPGEMSPAASIEIAIWAAVGGRATLIGPIIGAFFVNGAKSWFTVAFPEFWLYFLGALFIAVTLFLPNGSDRPAAPQVARAVHDPRTAAGRREAAPATRGAQELGHRIGRPQRRLRPAGARRPGRLHAGRGAVPRRHHRQLRRLQGAERADAGHQRRRAALHHRPQRRRQDDHDGRHHRQDPARRRQRLLRLDDRPAAHDRAADRADWHGPQVPEAHRLRAAHACSRTSSWR